MRVGKALKGCGKLGQAAGAFVNAYRDVDEQTGDGVKVELLSEIVALCGSGVGKWAILLLIVGLEVPVQVKILIQK